MSHGDWLIELLYGIGCALIVGALASLIVYLVCS